MYVCVYIYIYIHIYMYLFIYVLRLHYVHPLFTLSLLGHTHQIQVLYCNSLQLHLNHSPWLHYAHLLLTLSLSGHTHQSQLRPPLPHHLSLLPILLLLWLTLQVLSLFLLETSLHLPHQLLSLYHVQLSYSTLHLLHYLPPKHSFEIIIGLSHHHSPPEDSGQTHPRKFLDISGTEPHCWLTLNCCLLYYIWSTSCIVNSVMKIGWCQ